MVPLLDMPGKVTRRSSPGAGRTAGTALVQNIRKPNTTLKCHQSSSTIPGKVISRSPRRLPYRRYCSSLSKSFSHGTASMGFKSIRSSAASVALESSARRCISVRAAWGARPAATSASRVRSSARMRSSSAAEAVDEIVVVKVAYMLSGSAAPSLPMLQAFGSLRSFKFGNP